MLTMATNNSETMYVYSFLPILMMSDAELWNIVLNAILSAALLSLLSLLLISGTYLFLP